MDGNITTTVTVYVTLVPTLTYTHCFVVAVVFEVDSMLIIVAAASTSKAKIS
jgi:hypothetical protein